LLPFIIQFLMLLARNSYFDNWTWPPALVVVFVCNVLLAVAAWCLLRATAQKVRVSALKQLKSSLLNVRFQLASAGSADTLAKDKLALKEMIKRIEQEKAGAYSRIIQDPALLAVMLPTGALGILSILVQAFLGKL